MRMAYLYRVYAASASRYRGRMATLEPPIQRDRVGIRRRSIDKPGTRAK